MYAPPSACSQAGLTSLDVYKRQLQDIGGNIRVGSPELFVTEACEYTNSFLSFHPTMEVILNIEEDHLDFFKDIQDIRHSFRLFAEKLPSRGLLVINSGIDAVEELSLIHI